MRLLLAMNGNGSLFDGIGMHFFSVGSTNRREEIKQLNSQATFGILSYAYVVPRWCKML